MSAQTDIIMKLNNTISVQNDTNRLLQNKINELIIENNALKKRVYTTDAAHRVEEPILIPANTIHQEAKPQQYWTQSPEEIPINSVDQFPPLATYTDKLKMTVNVPSIASSKPITKIPERSRPALQGKRALESCKIKTVRKRNAVFVGGLDQETTEEGLREYLKEGRVEGVEIYKLEGKDKRGRKFKSAAFKIIFDSRHNSVMFNADTWPENCVVRQWIYIARSAVQARSPTPSASHTATNDHGNEDTEAVFFDA